MVQFPAGEHTDRGNNDGDVAMMNGMLPPAHAVFGTRHR
jgi:hypothetical protein